MVGARANKDRLWSTHMDLAKIGATPGGGVGRLALTDLDRQARDLFVSWCREAGCAVRVDRIGNIFARRAGTDESLSPVMTGSHLDTQPLGGRFDGIFGVLAGLEAVRALDEAGTKTRRPIDVVVWTDEEGARFRTGLMGSHVFCEPETLGKALANRDEQGSLVGDELTRIGYAGTELPGIPVHAYFEAHIEQGPVLEKAGIVIGVVEGAQGSMRFRVTVTGEEGHAGTLPMTQRHDALLGAARMIDAVNKVAFQHDPHPVITVGAMQVRPNSPNTVPGGAVFTIDARHPESKVLDAIDREMRAACARIAEADGLGLKVEQTSDNDPVAFDPRCVASVRAAAKALGISHRDIFSGAGHDACNLARIAPTGMIFVPCEKGISHNEKENARPEDLAAGCDVLIQVLAEWAA